MFYEEILIFIKYFLVLKTSNIIKINYFIFIKQTIIYHHHYVNEKK